MAFNPRVNQELVIEGVSYRFTEHPAVPGWVYSQIGSRAKIYQLESQYGRLYALKVFNERFRKLELLERSTQLRPFSYMPGLQVCARTTLSPEQHKDLLDRYPDLCYAALMPWISGQTWAEIILGRVPLTAERSYRFASALASTLAHIERAEVAHGDLSAGNVVLDPVTVTFELVDVEELYGPGLPAPETLSKGSDGYAHRTFAAAGLWVADMDRFAGAVLLAEMLAWCDDRVREKSAKEHYFGKDEVQVVPSERYEELLAVLYERWGRDIADEFARAWSSEFLSECPSLVRWEQLILAAAPVRKRPALQRWWAVAAAALTAMLLIFAVLAYQNMPGDDVSNSVQSTQTGIAVMTGTTLAMSVSPTTPGEVEISESDDMGTALAVAMKTAVARPAGTFTPVPSVSPVLFP